MPLYEYDCEQCSTRFSLLQSVGTTEKDTTCPECGAATVKKVISACSLGCFGGGLSTSSMPSGGG